MTEQKLLLALLQEAYQRKTWHGPNLRQSLKGVSAKQAAWRPAAGRHNIWELVVHSAYWKYAVRRKLEGGKRGSFALKGSNFFARPDEGKASEAAWRADLALLHSEHRALEQSIAEALQRPITEKQFQMLYGICFHDIYHAGQIRLLRRLMSSLRPIATLAMLLCRRIARCMYRRRQSG
jgi:uncharacterized damage-inducible protein DinB